MGGTHMASVDFRYRVRKCDPITRLSPVVRTGSQSVLLHILDQTPE